MQLVRKLANQVVFISIESKLYLTRMQHEQGREQFAVTSLEKLRKFFFNSSLFTPNIVTLVTTEARKQKLMKSIPLLDQWPCSFAAGKKIFLFRLFFGNQLFYRLREPIIFPKISMFCWVLRSEFGSERIFWNSNFEPSATIFIIPFNITKVLLLLWWT